MALGLHIIAEFNDCSNKIIDDIQITESYLNEAAILAGATIVKSVFHKFAPQGISGVVVIEESHFAIHTWPENSYAAVDLFTCSDKMDYKKALDFLKEKFECENLEFQVIERGLKAVKPSALCE
jgi:S-adenosylmethionine decarboxylase proenzyme